VQYQRLALPHLKELCFIEALRLPGGKNGQQRQDHLLLLIPNQRIRSPLPRIDNEKRQATREYCDGNRYSVFPPIRKILASGNRVITSRHRDMNMRH